MGPMGHTGTELPNGGQPPWGGEVPPAYQTAEIQSCGSWQSCNQVGYLYTAPYLSSMCHVTSRGERHWFLIPGHILAAAGQGKAWRPRNAG